jgi:glycosyltransferase involved in cell wall biosynthesis
MLTVLFATYNGEQTLPAVLQAYCGVESPPGGWKLVVVDNGSSDQTSRIIGSFSHLLPLTYLSESRRGKNAALNTGLEHISGDLVVLTDDDVIPRPDWLLQLQNCSTAHPDFAVFGGVVLPRWERTPEPWIFRLPTLESAFSVTNPNWEEGPISAAYIFGPNMAVRSTIFQRKYRFRMSIGPCGQTYAMGSETEFTRRLAQNGYQCWHCKTAIVEHIIRSFQMNKDWVLNRTVQFGRGQFRLKALESGTPPRLVWGYPSYLLKQIVQQAARLVWSAVNADSDTVFHERRKLNYLFGSAIEAREFYRQQPGTHDAV